MGEYLVDLSILDGLLVDDFLELIVGKLADHDHIILDNNCLTIQPILSEHTVDGSFSFLFALRFHP